jgi:PAS domain S-box-containing protein
MIESVFQEITERKRAEQALKVSQVELKESEEKYHTLFDYDPNAIFVLELETLKILDVNARTLEVYGYEKDELIGRSFMDLGTPDYPDGVLSTTKLMPSKRYSVYPKVHHKRKDGESFYVDVHACKRGRSRKYGIIATTVDITESLAKETQLIQASKMSTLGEMATGVAHELNQPLTTIQIGADFIQGMNKEGKQIPDNVLALISEQMIEQVKRAVHIINHLREFGRKVEIQRERVDVNKPIHDVFTLLGRQLKLRDIKVVLDLSEDLPPITGDSIRLEQVFVDLINNARDAMEAKTKQATGVRLDNTLTVRSFQQDGQVVVTITDTGTGIPDNIIDKIFEPFFTTKNVGEGTGLGLSIGYGIIKDYNGTLEVKSKVGEGTTFKISFPAGEEDERES